MWKLISLSALLIVAQAANINDFYGDWIEVAFYPVSIRVCVRFSFEESTENVQCVYADGRNTTTVQLSMTNVAGQLVHRISMPIIAVDTAAEVMPALNISCKCGDKEVRDRAVARFVNDDYFILYHLDKEQSNALLFAKEVVPATSLNDVMTNIEDLKNRQGTMVCTKENYSGFKSDNEVL